MGEYLSTGGYITAVQWRDYSSIVVRLLEYYIESTHFLTSSTAIVVIFLLSHHYIKHHHQHEADGETYSAEITVLTA